MSLALIRTKVTEAMDAWESGDPTTARSKLISAKILWSALPKRYVHGNSGQGIEEGEYDPAAIDSMLALLDGEVASTAAVTAGGMHYTEINYGRSVDCE